MMNVRIAPILLLLAQACSAPTSKVTDAVADTVIPQATSAHVVTPLFVTDSVQFDTDDPAIWINPSNAAESLVIGTDKDENGGLYVFDLKGKIKNVVKNLKRPDNVDIEYGLLLKGQPTDIAVATERLTHKLRVYSLPDMKAIDRGGLPVFESETGDMYRDLMGIALYKNPVTKNIYAIVGRKNGPVDGTYLWQYLLDDNGKGDVKATLVRKFGAYSGKKEIEAIAVDDKLGYVYYSDEGVGVRKYYADPEKGNNELALFAQSGFTQDHEGISIYDVNDSTGYILISDQQANQFFIYSREGKEGAPHEHQLIRVIRASSMESDGSDVTSVALNDDFRKGMFVVMSADRTFQYYRWEDIAGKDLKIASEANQ